MRKNPARSRSTTSDSKPREKASAGNTRRVLVKKSAHATKSAKALTIDGNTLRLEDVESVARSATVVRLSPRARKQLDDSRKIVEEILAKKELAYGITTGFGKF